MARNLMNWIRPIIVGLGCSVIVSAAVAQDAPTLAQVEPAEEANEADEADDDALSPAEDAEDADEDAEDEVIRERYPNTAVKIERHVAQDSEGNYYNQGLWTQWDDKGRLVGSGEYRKGLRHSKWVRWYGPKEGEMFTGPLYNEFTPPFASEATFADGSLQGTWKIFDSKNRKVSEWEFDQNERHGKSIWWYPSGQKRREVDYRNGQIDGELTEWGSDNKITTKDKYVAGRKSAKQTEWYAPGQRLSEGWVLYAREVTKSSYNWWDGLATAAVVAKEGENQKHGQWTWWHKNGQKQMEGSYEDNAPVGKFTWWYSNGQKQLQGEYVNGKQNGKFIWWHINGQKQLEGDYTAGTQHGKWMRWTADGKVVEVGDYSGEQAKEEQAKEESDAPGKADLLGEDLTDPSFQAGRPDDAKVETILK